MPRRDTPTVTAKVKAMDRDHSVNDRHRYEQMMILAARYERALREVHGILFQNHGIDATGPEEAAYKVADDALKL